MEDKHILRGVHYSYTQIQFTKFGGSGKVHLLGSAAAQLLARQWPRATGRGLVTRPTDLRIAGAKGHQEAFA